MDATVPATRSFTNWAACSADTLPDWMPAASALETSTPHDRTDSGSPMRVSTSPTSRPDAAMSACWLKYSIESAAVWWASERSETSCSSPSISLLSVTVSATSSWVLFAPLSTSSW